MLASKKIRTYIWYGYKEYVTYSLNLFSNLMYNMFCAQENYVEVLKILNPLLKCEVSREEDDVTFKQLLLIMPWAKEAFLLCNGIVGIDGAHLKDVAAPVIMADDLTEGIF